MNDDVRNYIKEGLRAGELKLKPRKRFLILKLSLSALVLFVVAIGTQKRSTRPPAVDSHFVLNEIPQHFENFNLFLKDEQGREDLDWDAFNTQFPMLSVNDLDLVPKTMSENHQDIMSTVVLERRTDASFVEVYLNRQNFDSVLASDDVLAQVEQELSCAITSEENCTGLKRSNIGTTPMILFGDSVLKYSFFIYDGVYIGIHSNLNMDAFEIFITELLSS